MGSELITAESPLRESTLTPRFRFRDKLRHYFYKVAILNEPTT